uniref:Uncharacterized protein n=1 Tax=Trichuris muris TaxID=70415 RepID=A0A5S6QK84_TRIMR
MIIYIGMILILCVIAHLLCEGDGISQDVAFQQANVHGSVLIACPFGKEMKRPKPPHVPKNLQSWNESYPGYSPIKWTESCGYKECDPEISLSGFNPKFNEKDGNVNRKSAGSVCHCGSYLIRDHLPLNPGGRTGLIGRGMLPRYGPNHLVGVIFIWESNGKLTVLKRSINSSYEDSLLTGFVDDPDKHPLPLHLYESVKEGLMQKYMDDKKVKKIMKRQHKKFLKLLAGSIPSQWETDNAWIELTLFIIPCQKTKLLCRYGLPLLKRERGLDWYVEDGKNNSLARMGIDETAMSMINRTNYSSNENGCMKRSFKWFLVSLMLGAAISATAAATVIFFVLGMVSPLFLGGIVGACLIPPALAAFAAVVYHHFKPRHSREMCD